MLRSPADVTPDFLAIGHVVRDVTPDGYRLGGAVTYGALTAHNLGLSAAIVTSSSQEHAMDIEGLDLPVHALPAEETTTFQNVYESGRRRQVIKAVAGAIGVPDVPGAWRSAPMVFLGPVADEISPELPSRFLDSLVAASIQGWLREWDDTGTVRHRAWDGRDVLPNIDVAIVSVDDVGDDRLFDHWAALAPALIVTMGRQGARLYAEGCWQQIEPFPAREVDPTGAGDVFAAAYLVRYGETGDALESARFASCAASFCVEAVGMAGIPTRAQVEDRLKIDGS